VASGKTGTLAPAATRAAAVCTGKTARVLSRALGRGGGTTLPGDLAERIDPGLVHGLGQAIPNGSVLVTGTNGKTTTTRILAGALRGAGLEVITNPEGSNLLSGIATALLLRTDGWGRLAVSPSAIGVFEADEGAFPPAVAALSPRLVVITNLFRDQLDRYFEVDFVAQLWRRALQKLPATTTVVLNADDPQVAYLGEDLPAKVLYFGLDDRQWARSSLEHSADSRRCPKCGHDLLYGLSFYAHLGHYACKECGWRRPDARFAAWNVELQGLAGSRAQVATPAGDRTFQLPLAGLYNACNALAASAGASCLGVEMDLVQAAAQGVVGAFGRLEHVRIGDKQACVLLVKNPSGFNEGLRLVLSQDGPRWLLTALNDNGPDGRDVSWIWDVDFEMCQGRVALMTASGLRARDLVLRFKYGGLLDPGAGPASTPMRLLVDEDMVRAFFAAIERTPAAETLYVLTTYTAMWTLRRELVRRGYLAPFWQQARFEETQAR
jgi:lipid II isoglutaminyl synthase (glutamine-hydrolysing)